MNILLLVLTWLVTAVSFVIISKIPIGVEIDNFNKALISAAVFGILNVLLRGVLEVVTLPAEVIFSGFLVTLVINAIIFGLSAWLVEGFRLRWGVWSALLGSMALSIVNELLVKILPIV
ncbi:MAG TPA: phage holin family protein [Oscillatoriales cyanobacterium M59_W2019_021]|nr:MAG: phage holin family protein [Cyanobacteria bacterium J055]HIK31657.1 phage holin family protein [Oscillatoriales cyanobacterium M4454_W2019_049]HIK50356.1 phage holin family protein [Oscillatoriales cyanobacterium M59_W2019_021]